MKSILVSTTWRGPAPTDLAAVLDEMRGFDCDGIELGSTHFWRPDLEKIVGTRPLGRILVHNYFPPARKNLVLNLASIDEDVRAASLAHAHVCLAFARAIGAEGYTVHPGFLADAAVVEGRASHDFIFAKPRARRARAFSLMIESLKRLAEEAARLNVSLLVETEGSVTHRDVLLLDRADEVERLFDEIPSGIVLNLNLAHTRFSAAVNGFSVERFIARFAARIGAVELSDNDGTADQHESFSRVGGVLDWLPLLPDVPLILEFRDCGRAEVEESLALLRGASADARRDPVASPG